MKPDLIVVGGDLLDEQQTIKQEMANVRVWLEMLLEKTRAEIMIITGNHDNRLQRLITKHLPASLLEFFQDPLEMLIQGLPRTELVEMGLVNKLPDGHEIDMGASRYMALVGDALISHANYTGKHPGDASKKLREWIGNNRRWLGLPDIALAVQTHAHKLYQGEFEGGWYVAVEPGIGGDSSIQRFARKIGCRQGIRHPWFAWNQSPWRLPPSVQPGYDAPSAQ